MSALNPLLSPSVPCPLTVVSAPPSETRPFIQSQEGSHVNSDFLLVADPQSLVLSFCLVNIQLKPESSLKWSVSWDTLLCPSGTFLESGASFPEEPACTVTV